MQRNFILTDVMKTGHHTDLEDFINMNTFEDQSFDMTGEYYTIVVNYYTVRALFSSRPRYGNQRTTSVNKHSIQR